jgi:hypothetical protein
MIIDRAARGDREPAKLRNQANFALVDWLEGVGAAEAAGDSA